MQNFNWHIYLMNADGSGQKSLTKNVRNGFEPFWSPDGNWIAFSSNRAGNFDIYILKVEDALKSTDGAQVWRLTNTPGDDGGSVWRPVP